MTSAPISQLSIELDLAKGHKSGFPLKSPLLAASGCWGFSNEYADLIEMDLLGALIQTRSAGIHANQLAEITRRYWLAVWHFTPGYQTQACLRHCVISARNGSVCAVQL